MSTLDDVISTVLRAREDGPDALAAVALSFGSAMELGTLGNTALKARLAETRAALEATEATVTTLRAERDAAREALAAQDSAPDLDYPARAEVWRLREAVEALRARAERAEAERDRAVQEREAFSLRLSAALHERDEARDALDISRDSAREAREEIAQSLALVDDASAALDAALARHTYEVRTVAPTLAEREAHQAAGGAWLVCRIDSDGKLHADVLIGWHGWRWEGYFFVALDAKRRPCAWPVAP